MDSMDFDRLAYMIHVATDSQRLFIAAMEAAEFPDVEKRKQLLALAFGKRSSGMLMGVSNLARRLGVTNKWVKEQAYEGLIPSLAVDDKYMFNLEAVTRVLLERAEN